MIKFKDKTGNADEALLRALSDFKEKIFSHNIPLHGFLLLRDDNILAEEYFEPYGKDSLHRMYSVTKSFTSLAIGLLCRDGRISLDDRIYTYFTDTYDCSNLHPWFKALTIREMLMMQTCFTKTTYNQLTDSDWAKSYFTAKPTHKSGTVFSYDTSSSQVLAFLVEKLTGLSLLDYLRVKVLDEIGFSKEAYILTDPSGVSQGGTGLNATLRDIAKVLYLIANDGIYNGKELLPKEYIKEATSLLTPTPVQPAIDEAAGYGYMFWRTRHEGFVMYGMGGQLMMHFPEIHLSILTIADTVGIPSGLNVIYDSFYENLYPLFGGERTAYVPLNEGTCKYGTYIFDDAAFESITLSDECLSFTFKDKKHVDFEFKLNQKVKSTFLPTGEMLFTDSFMDMGHLVIKSYITDYDPGHVFFDIVTLDDTLTLRMESTSKPELCYFTGIHTGSLM